MTNLILPSTADPITLSPSQTSNAQTNSSLKEVSWIAAFLTETAPTTATPTWTALTTAAPTTNPQAQGKVVKKRNFM